MKDHFQRNRETAARLVDPSVADNMDVRIAILNRIKGGEITLAQGQKELRGIQSKARKAGQPTAYRQ